MSEGLTTRLWIPVHQEAHISMKRGAHPMIPLVLAERGQPGQHAVLQPKKHEHPQPPGSYNAIACASSTSKFTLSAGKTSFIVWSFTRSRATVLFTLYMLPTRQRRKRCSLSSIRAAHSSRGMRRAAYEAHMSLCAKGGACSV